MDLDINGIIAAVRKTYADGGQPYSGNGLRKATVNVASGLIAYDLQAPAKNLYPVNTPIRNKLPRVKGNGDKTTHWVSVTAINGSGFDAIPYVPEGGRSGVMTLSTSPLNRAYTTFGEEINLTYEAWSAAEGFEDEKARNAIRLLQKMMLKEENALLGGNYSVALGATPAAPTVAVASVGGTIASGTYKCAYVALTYEGYRNWIASGALIATGVPTVLTITDPVGGQFLVNGGSSGASTITTAGSAITGTGVIQISATVIPGAVAYAWYVDDGASGNNTLQAVTTLNSIKLTSLTTSGQNITAITADHSVNIGATVGGIQGVTAVDGLLYAAWASNGNLNTTSYSQAAYVKSLATGTAGTGTKLTASGAGTVNEIDTMLQYMWDNWQVTPTVIYMNSQQIQDVTLLCLTGSSAPLLRYDVDPGTGFKNLVAGGVIAYYYNKFGQQGGSKIPVVIHPFLPAGTILAVTENLPIQYQSSEVPNVAEVHFRRDYYQIDWPPRTRLFESGVYSEETLAVYFPPGLGIITNIAPGT